MWEGGRRQRGLHVCFPFPWELARALLLPVWIMSPAGAQAPVVVWVGRSLATGTRLGRPAEPTTALGLGSKPLLSIPSANWDQLGSSPSPPAANFSCNCGSSLTSFRFFIVPLSAGEGELKVATFFNCMVTSEMNPRAVALASLDGHQGQERALRAGGRKTA